MTASSSSTTTSAAATSQEFWARALGYLVGFGSVLLYTPIALRITRQRQADGLVISTWWLKLAGYLLNLVYFVRKSYELSTYVESVVIALEAFLVLVLVAYYQKKYTEGSFWVWTIALLVGTLYGLTLAPLPLLASGQVLSAFVNIGALVPQFWHNFCRQQKGDYSPLTAGLAVTGCGIRLFTTKTLNGSDPVLLFTFFLAFLVNLGLLGQIIYYGVFVEGLTLWQVLAADVVTAHNNYNPRNSSSNNNNTFRARHNHDLDGSVWDDDSNGDAGVSMQLT